jgi:hypothetical protein
MTADVICEVLECICPDVHSDELTAIIHTKDDAATSRVRERAKRLDGFPNQGQASLEFKPIPFTGTD